jgi:hypothetical protein
MVLAVMAEEMQEQLLEWEEELTRREEALAVQEEKVRISMKALVKVSANLDAEWAKAEATQKEYIDKMEVHTARAKNSKGVPHQVAGGEEKVHLNGRESDLNVIPRFRKR